MGGWIRGALGLQIWGAPFLPPICVKTLVLKVFGEILRQKWGAPNLQIQRPTDPTPHLKPSEGNEWSRSCREINQHPSLPWDFFTHGFLEPSAFSELCFWAFLGGGGGFGLKERRRVETLASLLTGARIKADGPKASLIDILSGTSFR